MMSLLVILAEAYSFRDLGIWDCMSLILSLVLEDSRDIFSLPKFLTSTPDFGIPPQRTLIYFYIYLLSHWKSSGSIRLMSN